jgi:ribosomal protein L18E
MEPENQTVIDIECEPIDTSESEPEETWYSAQQMMSLLRLSKADLQKSISKLQSIYGLNLATLRRGAARATEYSQLALDATKLLNAGKLTQLRQLVEKAPAAASTSQVNGSLTISEYTPALDRRIAELNQTANSNSASLNQNVMQLLAQIAKENQAAQQRDANLDNAEINAAQNRGAARALAVFQAEQKAQNEVLAQLRAMQLGGNP